jgi:N-hydroxyarylamine O-acetyltransferase
MLGLGLRRVDDREPAAARALTTRADWFAALTDVFGLRLDDADPDAIDRLWDKTLDAHRAWEEKQAANAR